MIIVYYYYIFLNMINQIIENLCYILTNLKKIAGFHGYDTG